MLHCVRRALLGKDISSFRRGDVRREARRPLLMGSCKRGTGGTGCSSAVGSSGWKAWQAPISSCLTTVEYSSRQQGAAHSTGFRFGPVRSSLSTWGSKKPEPAGEKPRAVTVTRGDAPAECPIRVRG